MKKKTKMKIVIFSIIYLLGLYIAITSISTSTDKVQVFSKTFKGVEYSNATQEYEVKELTFEGDFRNHLIGKSTFKGEIIYDGFSYRSDFKIKDGYSKWIIDQGEGLSSLPSLGLLYIDDGLESVTLLIFNKDKSWTSDTGLIFSGNALTRDEARGLTVENIKDNGDAVEKW